VSSLPRAFINSCTSVARRRFFSPHSRSCWNRPTKVSAGQNELRKASSPRKSCSASRVTAALVWWLVG